MSLLPAVTGRLADGAQRHIDLAQAAGGAPARLETGCSGRATAEGLDIGQPLCRANWRRTDENRSALAPLTLVNVPGTAIARDLPRCSKRCRMQLPLQIVFEHLEHSDALEANVRKEAARLERFYDRITSARVVMGRPQHRHHKSDTYSVRVHLEVPGGEDIVVSRDPGATGRHEDAHVTIRDAFDAAGRQLQDFVGRR
jgi:ribosome-associated translation inhibitor RaiA